MALPAESLRAALSSEQEIELVSLFKVFEERNHKMPCRDLGVAFRVLGTELSKEQVQAYVTLYSHDGVYFTKEEFLEIAGEVRLSKEDGEVEQMLEEAYQLFDSHGSGAVSAKQLERVVGQLNVALTAAGVEGEDCSEESLQALIRDLDEDGLGITKHMFVDMLKTSSSIM